MNKKHIALKNLNDAFAIDCQPSGSVGYSQEWFPTEWQRKSGCGPVAACTIATYMQHGSGEAGVPRERAGCVERMEEAWGYVTPGTEGMPSTRMFRDGFVRYAASKGFSVVPYNLEVSDDASLRPDVPAVLRFIEAGLSADAPVAFLNLCNGNVENLDRWHWVTIIALSGSAGSGEGVVTVLDEGEVLEIDVALWTETTKRGGGFVYFLEGEIDEIY